MEKNKKIYKNENGEKYVVRTIKTDFDDGFVKESEVHRVTGVEDIGKSHLGKQIHFSFETSDPKIVRIAAFFFCLFCSGMGYLGYKMSGSKEKIFFYFCVILGIVSFVSINIDLRRRQKEKEKKQKQEK